MNGSGDDGIRLGADHGGEMTIGDKPTSDDAPGDGDAVDLAAEPTDPDAKPPAVMNDDRDQQLDVVAKEQSRFRLPGMLLLAGIVATLAGVSASWTSDDPTLRRLLDGPTNGWIPLLSSVLALAVLSRFVRGHWPAIIAIVLVAAGALAVHG